MARQRKDITAAQFEQATKHLAEGGTKKGACDILGVSNNRTMESRIAEYREDCERSARFRKEKRGTLIEGAELVNIITSYINGASLVELSESYYRSVTSIKTKLDKVGALFNRNESPNPLNPAALPDICLETPVDIGDVVYVPGYQCFGEVMSEAKSSVKAFRVYLLDQEQHRYVTYPEYELGSLKHLESIGLNTQRIKDEYMKKDQVTQLLYAARLAANKSKQKRAA